MVVAFARAPLRRLRLLRALGCAARAANNTAGAGFAFFIVVASRFLSWRVPVVVRAWPNADA